MKYLLTCSACQRDIPVEGGQAGQRLQCDCGQQVEVPTIRQLRLLWPADETPAVTSRWNRRQGFRFLGAAIMALGVALAGYIWLAWPKLFDAAAIAREIQSQPPYVAFLRLQSLEPPMPTPATERVESAPQLAPSKKLLLLVEGAGPQSLAPQQTYHSYEQLRSRHTLQQLLPFAGILVAVGMVVLGIGLLSQGDNPSRHSAKRPARRTTSPIAQSSGSDSRDNE